MRGQGTEPGTWVAVSAAPCLRGDRRSIVSFTMALRRICLFAMLALLASASWAEAPLRHLPYDDPIYPFLEKAYARGWIGYLPQIRPYSEAQALAFLDEVDTYFRGHEERGADLAQEQLRSYRERLSGMVHHVLGLSWGQDSRASLDFPVSFDANVRANNPSDTFLSLGPAFDLRASVSERLYFGLYTSYGASLVTWDTPPFGKFGFPPREDYAVYQFYLTRGLSGFTHLDQLRTLHQPGEADLFFWMNSTSQISVDFTLGTMSLGRGALSWGPSPVANLALSQQTKPYEYLHILVPLGVRASYTWATGFLQDYLTEDTADFADKILNVHRLEAQPTDWLLVAVYEAIVYSRRFELAYLNPLSVYAVSEVRTGDLDNKFGGADAVLRLPPVKLYFSMFVDDWDFGHLLDPFYYHNEWGGIAGVEAFDLVPNLGLRLEYVLLSHWMYTHRADFSDAGNNLNRYKHFGTHLGHPLDPNSHMISLDATYDLDADLRLGTSLWFTQNGGGGFAGGTYDRGDIDSPPDWAFEATLPGWPRNQFLDGIVESVFDWTVSAEYRMPKYRLSLGGSYSLQYTHNLNKVEGAVRWDHLVAIDVRWMMD
jgi:hypothetical protein